MRTREEVVKFIESQFSGETGVKKVTWHYGKMELRQLMDYIYGSPPIKDSEELFNGVGEKCSSYFDAYILQDAS